MQPHPTHRAFAGDASSQTPGGSPGGEGREGGGREGGREGGRREGGREREEEGREGRREGGREGGREEGGREGGITFIASWGDGAVASPLTMLWTQKRKAVTPNHLATPFQVSGK